jgi:hypothetical protein
MAKPSSILGTLSLWEECRTQIEAGLAQERKRLQDFESGRLRVGQRSDDDPWRDVTEEWVKRHKRLIAMFESVLAALREADESWGR